jgi:hypothetical protein
MSRRTKLPSIPRLQTKDGSLHKFAAGMYELMEVWRGNKGAADKVVTVGDLVDSGGFSYSGVSSGGGATSGMTFTGSVDLDTAPPAKVQNVVVSPALTSVFITWDALAQTNISYYEVWRNEANTFDGNQLRIGTSITAMYSDAIGDTEKTYYYWVRAISTADIAGPYNATTGLVGATAAIALTNLASGLTMVEIFAALPTLDNFEGRVVVLTTEENQLYRYTAGAWNKEVNGANLATGSVYYGAIGAGAVRANEIDALAISAGHIVGGTITADKMGVTSLSAITANLGSITGGSLSINGKFIVDSNGNTTIQSGTSGARMKMENDVIKVYDSSGSLRVKIGNLNG